MEFRYFLFVACYLKMFTCYIGIGSNLGDRENNIKRAIAQLRSTRGVKIEKISKFYQTKPEEFLNQGDFLNGVIYLQTFLSPQRLFRRLKKIEKDLGRHKTFRFGPRIIDLDVLLYDNQRIKSKALTIPHPRMYRRDFVLKPLKDVAPFLFKHKIIKSISLMRAFVKSARAKNQTIGFVPTMGCLHEGHLSLVRQAKADCDIVIVSIFVNPSQFGPKEDFDKYPRDLKRDEKLLKGIGVDVIFYPSKEEIYPEGFLTYVNVERISDILCGASRLNHFRAVATVVTKLFNIIQPDVAYFGQKDAQQATVIKKLVSDLNIPLKIKLMPIVREVNGLAMSSRNTYLTAQERKDAPVLYYSLVDAKALIEKGEHDAGRVIFSISDKIKRVKSARIDYVEIVDARTLVKIKKISGKILIALAVWFGKTRLIDNVIIKVT